jgi:hypothetical protein
MKKLAKTILAGVWWLGRGTATIMGIAVMLALTVGLASTALAGTGIGARFDLGKINKVNAMSTLVGNVDGPLLTLKNTNDPFIRTFRNVPLSLETRPDAGGQRPAPMQIDSDTLVQSLNADLLDGKGAAEFATGRGGKANDADKLDGKDSTAFVPTKIYEVQDRRPGLGSNSVTSRFATCDPGDPALSGGGFSTDPSGDTLVSSLRSSTSQWQAVYRDGGSANSDIGAIAYCADLPPLR